MKKILPVLMLLALFCIPRESKAYCFTYSKTVNFAAPGWGKWGNWVQPSSFVTLPAQPNNRAWIHLDRLESSGRFGILERVFSFSEVNNVVTTPTIGGCPPSHLPPDPVLNPLRACQATVTIQSVTGDGPINFSLQMINASNNQYIAIRNVHFNSQPSPGSFQVSSGLVTTTTPALSGGSVCVPNVLVRIQLDSTPPGASDLLVSNARVDYYTNPN